VLKLYLLSKRLTFVAFELRLANQVVGKGMVRQPAWLKRLGMNKNNRETSYLLFLDANRRAHGLLWQKDMA